jgi:hypothetical protein
MKATAVLNGHQFAVEVSPRLTSVPCSMLSAIKQMDPFQRLGIPCWKGVSGPLDNPNDPDAPFVEND